MSYTTLDQVAERAAAKVLAGGHVIIFGPQQPARHLFDAVMFDRILAVIPGGDIEHGQLSPPYARLANGGRIATASNETYLLGRRIDILIQFSPTRRGLVVEAFGGEVIDIRIPDPKSSGLQTKL